MEREAAVLGDLERERPDLAGVPRLRSSGFSAGGRAVLQDAMLGAPLQAELDRTGFAGLAPALTEWLASLAGNPPPQAASEWFGRLVGDPLDELEADFGELVPPGFAHRARAALADSATLPLVWEHRDLGPWNVVIREDGGPAAIDWEDAEPRGLPCLDLVYLLASSALLLDGALNDTRDTGPIAESYGGCSTRPARPAGSRRGASPSTATGSASARPTSAPALALLDRPSADLLPPPSPKPALLHPISPRASCDGWRSQTVTPSQLSVLIASHNRREMLARCLAALAAQSEDPAAFEVIVADDGSTDGTAAALAELSTPFELRVIEHAKAGKPVVLNAAIDAARGEVCLFIDDDMIASPQLVAEHLAAHRREPRTLGIGVLVQREPEGEDWYVRAFTRAWNEHFEELRARPARWTDCYGANFSAPRLDPAGDRRLRFRRADGRGLRHRLSARRRRARGPLPPQRHRGARRREDARADARRHQAGGCRLRRVRRPPSRHRKRAPRLAGRAGPVELRLRRGLIALRVPPGPVAALGALVPGDGRKMVWLHFVRRLVLWRAARGAMTRGRWREVTRQGGPR